MPSYILFRNPSWVWRWMGVGRFRGDQFTLQNYFSLDSWIQTFHPILKGKLPPYLHNSWVVIRQSSRKQVLSNISPVFTHLRKQASRGLLLIPRTSDLCQEDQTPTSLWYLPKLFWATHRHLLDHIISAEPAFLLRKTYILTSSTRHIRELSGLAGTQRLPISCHTTSY